MIHDTIKQRLRASLLVTASGKNTLDTAARLASELREDGSWSDLGDFAADCSVLRKQGHLARTMLLAKACHLAPGELDGATRLAFDRWLARDFRPADWYQDQVTIPRLVGEIALLCEDELSVGAWGKVTEILTRSRWAHWIPHSGWTEWTGTPAVEVAYNVILRGCLEDSPALCEAAFRRAFRKVDWSHCTDSISHVNVSSMESAPAEGRDPALIRDYARLMTLAHGTHWQAPTESAKAFVAYLLDFQQWMMWRGVQDDAAALPHVTEGLGAAIAQLAQLGNPPRRAELVDMADRLAGRGKALVGHRHFWRSHSTVHQRPEFYCSLTLGSLPSTQASNFAGDQSQALGTSLRFIRTGREYAGLIDERTSPWVPKLPAVYHGERQGLPWPGQAGTGVGLGEGEYGMAAMSSSGGDVRSKQAWFFFENSVVCLEAGLSAPPAEEPLFTRVNRCRSNGTVAVDTLKGGGRRLLAPAERHDLTGIHRVEHGGFLYYFPSPTQVVADLQPSANVERPTPHDDGGVFTLCINHGKHVHDGASACFVLPLDEDSASRSRVESEIAQIDVLANKPTLQAVRHRGSGLVSVVFWEASVLALPDGGRIASNSPCLLLGREDPSGSTSVTVANLLRGATVAHVEFHGSCVCFELPGGTEARRSFRRQL